MEVFYTNKSLAERLLNEIKDEQIKAAEKWLDIDNIELTGTEFIIMKQFYNTKDGNSLRLVTKRGPVECINSGN